MFFPYVQDFVALFYFFSHLPSLIFYITTYLAYTNVCSFLSFSLRCFACSHPFFTPQDLFFGAFLLLSSLSFYFSLFHSLFIVQQHLSFPVFLFALRLSHFRCSVFRYLLLHSLFRVIYSVLFVRHTFFVISCFTIFRNPSVSLSMCQETAIIVYLL